jgi:hypothetical protein
MKLVNEILVTSLEGRLWPKANVIKLLHNKLDRALVPGKPFQPIVGRVEPNVCG